AAALPDGGGAVALRPVARLVVLVGQQVRGQPGVAGGGADDAVAPQAGVQAIPVQGALAEDARQGPVGDAEGTQEQRGFDRAGVADHVGYGAGGPDEKAYAGGRAAAAAE